MCVSLFSLVLQGCSGFRTCVIILILFLILARATLHRRIANQAERTVVVEEVLYTFGWLFSCAFRTARESQGALAVSCSI